MLALSPLALRPTGAGFKELEEEPQGAHTIREDKRTSGTAGAGGHAGHNGRPCGLCGAHRAPGAPSARTSAAGRWNLPQTLPGRKGLKGEVSPACLSFSPRYFPLIPVSASRFTTSPRSHWCGAFFANSPLCPQKARCSQACVVAPHNSLFPPQSSFQSLLLHVSLARWFLGPGTQVSPAPARDPVRAGGAGYPHPQSPVQTCWPSLSVPKPSLGGKEAGHLSRRGAHANKSIFNWGTQILGEGKVLTDG